jgi:membrane protease YdiL (CAAX protease family)
VGDGASFGPIASDAATGGAPWLGAAGLATDGLASAALLFVLALIGAGLSREPIARALQLGRGTSAPATSDRLLYVLGTVALSQLLDRLIDLLGLREGSHLGAIEGTIATAHVTNLPLLLLGLALAPALAEETLFRGLALRQLGRRFGAAAGIAGSALLFGWVHMDLVHGIAASALGILLASVTVVTGGVRTAMACHFANNALAVATSLRIANGLAAGPGLVTMVDLLCVALVTASVHRLVQRWPATWPDPPPPSVSDSPVS